MIFHEFTMGDVEDPEIYAASPIYEWQQTDQGKWVLEHCSNASYKIMADYTSFGYRIVIYGDLSQEDATYFTLKYK